MHVLVLAPHPDDESLGCGGTIRLHVDRGDDVTVVFVTSGEAGLRESAPDEARATREEEARAAARVLGVGTLHFLRQPDAAVADSLRSATVALRPILRELEPAVAYLPHPDEAHPDHEVMLRLLGQALGDTPAPVVWLYEIWSPLPYYDHVEDVTSVMDVKLDAIRCHRSQLDLLPFDRAMLGLNQYRGATSWGCEYAEVFQHGQLDGL